jgi:hypothetical protein
MGILMSMRMRKMMEKRRMEKRRMEKRRTGSTSAQPHQVGLAD